MAQQVSFKEGHVQFLGEDVAFTPVSFLAEETKRYIDSGDLTGFYFSAWKSGYNITYKMVQKYGLKKFEERYRVAMDTLSMMGLGAYKTIEFKRAEYAHFKSIDNPLAIFLRNKSELPVDHFMRGANGGGGTIVHEVLINCVEIKCAAQGGNICEFYNLNNERVDKFKNKKLLDTQLDMSYLKEVEINYIKALGHDSFIKI